LIEGEKKKGPIVYWMSRDQRTEDNWALLFAQDLALRKDLPLVVVFCLVPQFLGATMSQYGFMLKGLREVEKRLKDRNIPFSLLQGEPSKEIPQFLEELGSAALVTDFSPLRAKINWIKSVALQIDVPFYEVDDHNIVLIGLRLQNRNMVPILFVPRCADFCQNFSMNSPNCKRCQGTVITNQIWIGIQLKGVWKWKRTLRRRTYSNPERLQQLVSYLPSWSKGLTVTRQPEMTHISMASQTYRLISI